MKKILPAIFAFLIFPVAALAYSDITDQHPYHAAIEAITEQGIVSGYPDDSFRPDAEINRAEFTKIMMRAGFAYEPDDNTSSSTPLPFSDVDPNGWYSPYLRKALEQGIVSGYPDGTFRPGATINVAEAAKIVVNSLNIPVGDSAGQAWYSRYLEVLATSNYLPPSFHYPAQAVNRGEMAELVWRALTRTTDLPSVIMVELENSCYPLGENIPESIDMGRVRSTWLSWYNTVRANEGLHAYIYNPQLNRSAIAWSETSKQKGTMDHKRDPGDAYYDYQKITNWFKQLGLEFENVYRVTHTENIGWGPFRCSKADCTDDLISGIRTTFDFYMAEKDKDYKPHYDSVMNRYFNEIGLGIAIDENAGKYYLTVHYGTKITSDPWPVCEE